MTRILFVCSMNQWRSPTAEQVFAHYPGIECLSAGLNHGADVELTADLLDWAELIFVMERAHRSRLTARFKRHLDGKRIICLGISDDYRFMDAALIQLLRAKVIPHLRARGVAI
jgi:predicted protein tyrosine phosphatase